MSGSFGSKSNRPDDKASSEQEAHIENADNLHNKLDEDRLQQYDKTGENSSTNLGDYASMTGNLGLSQAFILRKSENPLTSFDKPTFLIRPIVDKFLDDTAAISAAENISAAEAKELSRARDELMSAGDWQEVLDALDYLVRLYQHLAYTEESKKALKLIGDIDPNNAPVKDLLKELERMHPPDIAIASKPRFAAGLSKRQLRKCIENLSRGKVLVVGDQLLDELLEGKPERISREAPILILEHVDTELIPGGASNAANNIASFGAKCHVIGICGQDDYADKLAKVLERQGVSHSLIQDPSRPTTVKTRILSKSHALRQQLLRLDRISHEPISVDIEEKLAKCIQETAPAYQALILSDYRCGLISQKVVDACRHIAQSSNLLLVVDAQDNYQRFAGAALLTPNQPDTEACVGFAINDHESLKRAGEKMLQITQAKALLLTRGGEGMVLFERDKPMLELPAFNKTEVFDVTGAGDTVVATMTLALVTGASYYEAMALGNLAASIVVKKPGTATTTQAELLTNLELLNLEE